MQTENGKNDLSTPKPVDNMKKEAFATSLGSSFVYIENELPILKWEAKDMPISTATSTTTTTTSEPTSTTTSTTTTTTTTATTSTLTSTTTTSKPQISEMLTIEKEMAIGGKYSLKVGSDDLTFSSDNEKVAVVSESGIIEAVDSGKTTIVAKNSRNDVVRIEITVTKSLPAPEFGDINNDTIIDGRDASILLTYYAKTSTGYKGNLQSFVGEQIGIDPLTGQNVITTTELPQTTTSKKTTSTTTTTIPSVPVTSYSTSAYSIPEMPTTTSLSVDINHKNYTRISNLQISINSDMSSINDCYRNIEESTTRIADLNRTYLSHVKSLNSAYINLEKAKTQGVRTYSSAGGWTYEPSAAAIAKAKADIENYEGLVESYKGFLQRAENNRTYYIERIGQLRYRIETYQNQIQSLL